MKLELSTFETITLLYIMLDWVYMKIEYKEWSKGMALAGFAIALLITVIRMLGK